MITSQDSKKYYAVSKLDSLDLEKNVQSGYHEHVSSAIDEISKNVKDILRSQGYSGKFEIFVEVYAKENGKSRLIQTVKLKINVN
ncbi:hypothetical protein [Sulfolobus acidocaldarius]|uniref:Uncharacterized protein n=4 Tax=Sulfolobus acidocaldarius TaxID=2285 RepID=Q4JCE3_SULAC|nr:hypothetical protein [Sulfolobus acidocaldarius]AHC50631.1 hypothetical protein SUSAZ_00535 [Sulfolobus acidocaldarius SUSAZ]AAY79536.1 hypothetical protein Saci_0111 [Sulfolobus acidocaldarius DSM 639]AGE70086.1 hypothetical protein SacN8_00525 [Sulfolobus acidocaldarius N8]AGE72361.1 hypothetical protein SacRon12I_00525 [Sulfolobus acidocaldarius Ron12/I]ALU29493.1 hypothetical protein ATY89_05720 [Sulfolobus acidocaldarius]